MLARQSHWQIGSPLRNVQDKPLRLLHTWAEGIPELTRSCRGFLQKNPVLTVVLEWCGMAWLPRSLRALRQSRPAHGGWGWNAKPVIIVWLAI